MTLDVLHSPRDAGRGVEPAELPHHHREWTKFSAEIPPARVRGARKANAIRARKNTKLMWRSGDIELQFSGEDPGIAMDLRGQELKAGPYDLSFRLSTKLQGTGEVFFTTTPQQTLPRGHRIEFRVDAADKWQEVRVWLDTKDTIKQLRIDVADGPGAAILSGLELSDAAGNVLKQWSQPPDVRRE